MPSNHLILCRPLLLPPPVFPSISVFSNESAFCIRWPKYWSFSFSVGPSHEQSGLISFRWLLSTHRRVSRPLGATGEALKVGLRPEESALPPSPPQLHMEGGQDSGDRGCVCSGAGGCRTTGVPEHWGSRKEGSQLGSEQGLDAGVLTHALSRRPPRAEPGELSGASTWPRFSRPLP